MVRKLFFLFIAAMTLLVACGNEDVSEQDDSQNDEPSLLPLEVEILTESDAFEPGEEGKLEIKVTQGDENVDDANEVLFEIWEHGHEDESENFEGEGVGDGIYALAHTFEEEGLYYVIAHVTARDSHTMPRKEFVVGDVDADAIKEADNHDHDHDHGHDHGHGEVSIHFMQPDTIQANEAGQFIVHLEKDGEPFTEADVRFEYWKKGDDRHEFVRTEETVDGEYAAELTLEMTGEYEMTIHVEKGDIHEHKSATIDVQ